jgi:hypothetical protein
MSSFFFFLVSFFFPKMLGVYDPNRRLYFIDFEKYDIKNLMC